MHVLKSLLLLIGVIFLIASCGNKGSKDQAGQTSDANQTTPDSTLATTPSTTPPSTVEPTTSQPSSTKPTNPKPPAPKPVVPSYITMPESTAILITLVDSIDTDIHPTGMVFRARLVTPVVVNGTTLFEVGADAKGILDTVIESGRLKTPAEVEYHLTAIQDKNGDWVDINTFVIHEKQGSHTKREVAMIGGGAIIGGVIGKATGEKGGTEIGALAGAAAGTVTAALTGKKDIVYPVGTQIVFILQEPTKIAVK